MTGRPGWCRSCGGRARGCGGTFAPSVGLVVQQYRSTAATCFPQDGDELVARLVRWSSRTARATGSKAHSIRSPMSMPQQLRRGHRPLGHQRVGVGGRTGSRTASSRRSRRARPWPWWRRCAERSGTPSRRYSVYMAPGARRTPWLGSDGSGWSARALLVVVGCSGSQSSPDKVDAVAPGPVSSLDSSTRIVVDDAARQRPRSSITRGSRPPTAC